MKRKTDRGRMKFRAFMVCVLSFLVVTGSVCFLNREQEKEEKLKAVYAAESTVSRVKSQLNRYLAESELVKNIIESGYDIDGEVTTDFPTTAKLEKAKPVLKTLPGWKTDIRGIKKYEDLPENCRKYIEFVEEQIGFPITMVSNGPGREDIIYR